MAAGRTDTDKYSAQKLVEVDTEADRTSADKE
jgi:hypothetical protein